MAENNLFSILKNKFPQISEEAATQCVVILAENIQKVCLFLKEDLGFDYLMNLSALDYKDKFAVVYNFYSFKTKNLPDRQTGKLSLKVFLDKNNPRIWSVSKIWSTANWHEREAYDLMGITFIGHPDLRRILLPDDWLGHPLRKDYDQPGLVRMPQI